MSPKIRAITCEVILTSATTRADKSIGLRFSTQELSSEEKAIFFDLQNKELTMLLQPSQGTPDEAVVVKGRMEVKTPSQRLRATLYVLWNQTGQQIPFEDFYANRMAAMIEKVKGELSP